MVTVTVVTAYALTPPAMPHVAIAGGSGWCSVGYLLVYGMIQMIIGGVIAVIVGFSIACLVM